STSRAGVPALDAQGGTSEVGEEAVVPAAAAVVAPVQGGVQRLASEGLLSQAHQGGVVDGGDGAGLRAVGGVAAVLLRPLVRLVGPGRPLEDEGVLDLAPPALVEVDAVVPAGDAGEVLDVGGTAEELHVVVLVLVDVDVVDVGGAADGAQGQAVDLVV